MNYCVPTRKDNVHAPWPFWRKYEPRNKTKKAAPKKKTQTERKTVPVATAKSWRAEGGVLGEESNHRSKRIFFQRLSDFFY